MPAGRKTDRLPKAAAVLAGFGFVLRTNGFPVASEQTETFLRAIAMLGPRALGDVYQAAVACFSPQPERRSEFDELFRAYFHGTAQVAASGEAEQEPDTRDNAPEPDETGEAGDDASAAELLQARSLLAARDDETRLLARHLPEVLPKRRSLRQRVTPHGRRIHLGRSLRRLLRNDGDLPRPALSVRPFRARNVLILIDVSGSMKDRTDDYLRLAHTVVQHAPSAEVFAFATRLSRLTPALRHRDEVQALAAASVVVSDWDGGTRIGPCLAEFLSVPRFAGFARGAAVLVISDGMERGDIGVFVQAVTRLSRLAWRLSWASPLVADPRYAPKTRAMRAVLPVLGDLVDGSTVSALAKFLLGWTVSSHGAEEVWKRKITSP